MSIYQRDEVWYIYITAPNGKRIRKSANTTDKRQAQEYHDTLKAQLWREVKLGEKPIYSWQDAVLDWASNRKDNPSFYNDQLELKRLDKFLGKLTLPQITREVIETIKRSRIKDNVSNRTVNATLQCVRSVMRHALDNEWIDTVPTFKLLSEPQRRVRFLTELEEARMMKELPDHLVPMVKFSLMTGLRKSNVTGLTWQQVDIANSRAWIHHDQAKAGQAIPVPLNSQALLLIREQMGKHLTHVFSFKGNTIEEPAGKAWRLALNRAGLHDFRWHDLRHTWASRLIQRGVPLHALMEMGGWSDVSMVRKYAHFASSHLLEFAEKATGKNIVDNLQNSTNTPQIILAKN